MNGAGVDVAFGTPVSRHTFGTNASPMRANFGVMLAVGGGPGCPV